MRRPALSDQTGQVLIFVTLTFVVLGMFIGLAVDGGRAYLMRERLRSVVDAAALAGAKAMAVPSDPVQARDAAISAACDSAKVNGLDACNTEKLSVQVGPAPDGTLGVIVTGTDTSRTFFMALGGLIGCETCKSINVAHTGIAVPDTLLDLAIVMDDSGTMSQGCTTAQDNSECPIKGAKDGANELVSILLADVRSHARVAFVPFRGCYHPTGPNYPVDLPPDPTGRQGCVILTDVQDLTNDAASLTSQINKRKADGGFPGTNVCLALHEGKSRLFGSNGRAIARKVIVLLTDGDQTYSDHAWGGGNGGPNLASPVPNPYPRHPYSVSSGDGDGGVDTPSGSCKSPNPAGDSTSVPPNGLYDGAVYSLDKFAIAKANLLKKADPTGSSILCTSDATSNAPRCVELYVLRYAYPSGDDGASVECDPSLITNIAVSGRDYSNDARDRNLSRCLASNTVMADPFAVTANDHYFYATAAADINAKFREIAANILRKRRLVA